MLATAKTSLDTVCLDLVEGVELVRRIARQLVRKLPHHVELDELVSLGNLGLVEAHTRFQPSRGVPFAAFAARRIRGAMIDGMRTEDLLSRAERARQRVEAGAPIRSRADLSLAENAVVVEAEADHALVSRDEIEAVRRILPILSTRERFVVQRHFLDEARLKSIGEELSVTESRVCQILSTALARLRAAMIASERGPVGATQ